MNNVPVTSRKRILAVSSGGGHWVELLRMKPAFNDHEVTYVCVSDCYHEDVPDEPFYTINDATRWNWIGLLQMAWKLFMILRKEHPDVVISTGAAPGYLALRLAKNLTKARTIWVESLARVENLSLSGLKVGPYADLWLTQWPYPDEDKPEGLLYKGNVL